MNESSFNKTLFQGIPDLELPGTIARFGEHEIDFKAFEVRRAGRARAVPPQPLLLLMLLVSRAGRIVERSTIRDYLWGDHPPSDSNRSLNHAVRKLRRLLQDDARDASLIQTVHRRGYRFVHPVVWASESSGISSSTYSDAYSEIRSDPFGSMISSPVGGSSTSARPRKWTLFVSELIDGADDQAWPPLAEGTREELLSTLVHRQRVLDIQVIDGSPRGADGTAANGRRSFQLRGSIRRVGHIARIHCRLVSLEDESLVAAIGFELEVTSVFPWQQKVAERIVERLVQPFLSSAADRWTT